MLLLLRNIQAQSFRTDCTYVDFEVACIPEGNCWWLAILGLEWSDLSSLAQLQQFRLIILGYIGQVRLSHTALPLVLQGSFMRDAIRTTSVFKCPMSRCEVNF